MSDDLLPRLTSSDENIRETAYEDLSFDVDDSAADLLLSIASGDWPEDIRARAIVALGPVIEGCGIDYCDEIDFFDDPELLPSVSRRQFGTIIERLRSLYDDESQPLLVRRRAFENLVRDPQPWMAKEVRRLAASDEIDWRVTAVFAMGHLDGFGKEIVAALDDDSPQLVFEAIRAAGMQELRRAASRVRKFAMSAADRELRLEAIAALPFVDDDSLELLEKLSRSRDREVASVAKDAILELHGKWATDEAIADAELEEDQEDDDELLIAERARFRADVPEVDAVLDKLRSEEPRTLLEGVAEAVEKREIITPYLLQMIEGLTKENAGDLAATLAFYLLAQFRETRALEPLLRYFKNAGPDSHDDFGDVVTEDLPAILLSVSGSHIERLRELVEAEDADELSRSSALEALVRGVAFGLVPREELVGYLRELVDGRLEREPSHVWDTVAAAVAALGASELLDDVEAAFDEDLVADGMVSLEEVREDVARGANDALAFYRRYSHPPYIDDTAHAIRWWSLFSPSRGGSVRHGRDDDLPPARVPEAKPKVGRNEPCPCGSGKKYKKCCGA